MLVSETEIGIFKIMKKTCLQIKKLYLMSPSRYDHFHLILILPVKIVELLQQHANTTIHWFYTLPLPIVAKSSILNVAEFLDPSLKMLPCTKASPVLSENQSFFLLFQNVATFIESHYFFLSLLTI